MRSGVKFAHPRLRLILFVSTIETGLSLPDGASSPALGPAVEEQLLCIIQEALTNVRKHAAARRIEVLLMRERAGAVGGQVEIRSASGQGACVLIHIPCLVTASGSDAETSDLAGLRRTARRARLYRNQFCALLTDLLRDDAPLAPGLAARTMAEFSRQGDHEGDHEGRPYSTELTPRQQEILGLVAQGLIYKEIGRRLHLSEKTIKYHMSQILEKLHVENCVQAIAYFYRMRKKQTQ